jgi:hypothetical protein
MSDDTADPFRPGGVPLADHTSIQAARDKWRLNGEDMWWIIPKGQEEDLNFRAAILGLLLENQEKWFDEMEEQGEIPENIVELFGANWRHDVYTSMLRAWRTTPLVNICSIQPFTGPLGKVAYLHLRGASTVDGIPEIQLDIKLKEIQAEPRKSKVRFTSPTVLDRMVANTTLMDMAFEELLIEVTREVLGTMLNAAPVDEIEPDADVLDALRSASTDIFRSSQRAPANNIIGGQEILTKLGIKTPISKGGVEALGFALEGKWNVYFDPLFPKGKLMAWHQGPSLLDTGIIYSPYRFEFTRMDESCTIYAGRTRQKIAMVQPDYVRVIEISGGEEKVQ